MKFISLRIPFRRSNKFPLDMSSLFDSYEDALKYANGSGDTRGLGPTSYPGQIISVANNDSGVSIYQIAYDGTLKEIGKGGSGSSVVWQQILTGGTQIAKISIDGTEQIVYAPTEGSGKINDVLVKKDEETGYQTVVENKNAKIDLSELYTAIGKLDEEPTIIQPSFNIYFPSAGNYEVGTIVGISDRSISFNQGNYSFGPDDTGVKLISSSLTCSTEETSITVTESEFELTGTTTYSDGIIPKTKLGNNYESGKIIGNTISKNSDKITGCRYNFYISSQNIYTSFDSNIIRTFNNALDKNSFNINILANHKQVVIAIPESKTLSKVLDSNVFDANIVNNFVLVENILVEGANNYTAINYKVYYYTPTVPFSINNIYKITLS